MMSAPEVLIMSQKLKDKSLIKADKKDNCVFISLLLAGSTSTVLILSALIFFILAI